jgi:hypothetical protein
VIEPVEKLGAAIVVVQHWGDELNGLRPGR